MPDQPDDPLNYDMKIPPEPSAKKHEDAEPPESDGKTEKADTAKDTNVVRGDDKPQPGVTRDSGDADRTVSYRVPGI